MLDENVSLLRQYLSNEFFFGTVYLDVLRQLPMRVEE